MKWSGGTLKRQTSPKTAQTAWSGHEEGLQFANKINTNVQVSSQMN